MILDDTLKGKMRHAMEKRFGASASYQVFTFYQAREAHRITDAETGSFLEGHFTHNKRFIVTTMQKGKIAA